MNYIDKISQVKKSNILSNNYIFSPVRHFSVINSEKESYLIDLLDISSNKISINNKKMRFYYVEIGSINKINGLIEPTSRMPIELSSNKLCRLRKDDILISTVRTYLGGIGIVDDNVENYVCSNSIIVFRRKDKTVPLYYIFSILRTPYFFEQVKLILNTSMYPRMDKESLNRLVIPRISNKNGDSSKIEELVSLMQKNLLIKEKEIYERYKTIDNYIIEELKTNQTNEKFNYKWPRKNEISLNTRFDSGMYTCQFKENFYYINNYKFGVEYLSKSNIKSGSTPKTRIMNPKNEKYKWITPTDINDFGLLDSINYIDMPNSNNIKKDSMLIINRTSKGKYGEYVGISMFYDYGISGDAHHNQGIYRVEGGKSDLLFYTAIFNTTLYRKICASMTTGSKMKEMKSHDFSLIPIPKFDKTKRNLVNKMMYNEVEYIRKSQNEYINYEIERSKNLGLYQLREESRKMRKFIDHLIDRTILNKNISLQIFNEYFIT
ncbi:hypothetical protein RJI07_04810 [Mycoplasmatota bacterium WC30]